MSTIIMLDKLDKEIFELDCKVGLCNRELQGHTHT